MIRETNKEAPFNIGETQYDRSKVLIVAELGTSHGGDPHKARELIQAAAESGADAIKFQHFYADEILHPASGYVSLPGGNTKLYESFKRLERSLSFLAELKAEVEKQRRLFLCSPFGHKSASELWSLKPAALKIASPELNHYELLVETASYGLPIILSTGVSRLGDIERALDYYTKLPLCLLHCVTSYPAPEEEYNISLVANLRLVFGRPVGISDHSADPLLVPILAVSRGACVVEKHFCLSKADGGLDDPIALPPKTFSRMVEGIREAQSMTAENICDWIEDSYGSGRVDAVLGDGVKRLASSERDNYGRTNRSIHALKDIAKGEMIAEDAVRVLRTEKTLRPGLPPDWLRLIIGRRARYDIPAGEGVRFEDV